MIKEIIESLVIKFNVNSKKTKILDVYSMSKKNTILGKVISIGYDTGRYDCTEDDKVLQASFVNFFKGQEIKPHRHPEVSRSSSNTNEIWFITSGKFIVSFFDFDGKQIHSVNVKAGNLVLLFEGGHSLKSLKRKSQIIEVKNGPYYRMIQNKLLI
jgi:cupin fold WbuC family metalloprotein